MKKMNINSLKNLIPGGKKNAKAVATRPGFREILDKTGLDVVKETIDLLKTSEKEEIKLRCLELLARYSFALPHAPKAPEMTLPPLQINLSTESLVASLKQPEPIHVENESE